MLAMPSVPSGWPVQPIEQDRRVKNLCTCLTCGRSWDDGVSTSITPAPSGRCPFEYFHPTEEEESNVRRDKNVCRS